MFPVWNRKPNISASLESVLEQKAEKTMHHFHVTFQNRVTQVERKAIYDFFVLKRVTREERIAVLEGGNEVYGIRDQRPRKAPGSGITAARDRGFETWDV